MKRLILAATLGLVAAGCGSALTATAPPDTKPDAGNDAPTVEREVTPTTTAPPTTTTTAAPTTTAPPVTAPPPTVEQLLIGLVRSEYPDVFNAAIPDSQIIELANLTCDAFASGAGVEDVFAVILTETLPDQQEAFAYLVGAGTHAVCPEFDYLIQ